MENTLKSENCSVVWFIQSPRSSEKNNAASRCWSSHVERKLCCLYKPLDIAGACLSSICTKVLSLYQPAAPDENFIWLEYKIATRAKLFRGSAFAPPAVLIGPSMLIKFQIVIAVGQ